MANNQKTLTIGILAGEASGDNLGQGLMRELSVREKVKFVGVGGPKMCAEGLECLFDMDLLSVNGFREPLRRLPQLIRLFLQLLRDFEKHQIDAFVGVDFNVFNLLLEKRLKRRGVTTVHYVSPSVYSWRRGRVKRIGQSADRILTLYPFEPELYLGHKVDAVFVGHPMADAISTEAGDKFAQTTARKKLGLAEEVPIIALLPGSRSSEIKLMGDLLLSAADHLQKALSNVVFVVPCISTKIKSKMDELLQFHETLNVKLIRADARQALTAADAALVKSGTSTLEAMLLRKTMVVTYKLGALTGWFAKKVLKLPYVGLPNILAGRMLVPELLQGDAHPASLAKALLMEMEKNNNSDEYSSFCVSQHDQLRQNASARAAEAVLEVIQ